MILTLIYRIKDTILGIGASWDKLAPDKDTAIDFAHTHINEEPLPKTDNGDSTLEYVLAHDGQLINKHFREDRPDGRDRVIAAMVANYSTDTDLILYRGVDDDVFRQMKENAKNMPDCDLFEKGFLATSLVKGHEKKCKHKLRIFVPACTTCVYLGNVNNEQNSYEVDVMHGARLKIESIDSVYINCRVIDTE